MSSADVLVAVLLGGVLGCGVLLVLAPRLWPRSTRPRQNSRIGTAIRDRLTGADLETVGTGVFLTVSAMLGVAAGALVLAVTAVPLLAALACVAACTAPWLVAGMRASSRRRAQRRVWPDVIDHLVGSIRAGVPLADAVAALGSTGPVRLRPAFQAFAARFHGTGDVGRAIDETKRRLADPTADRILETLRMAREVGGTELPGVLRGLGAHLRQDAATRAELEARQSWTTNAAKLGVAAPWIVLLMLATRPDAAAAYAGPAGSVLILTGLGVSVLAYRVMLLIGRLPEERRWFR